MPVSPISNEINDTNHVCRDGIDESSMLMVLSKEQYLVKSCYKL